MSVDSSGMLREGSGEPLLLLHGVICSERIWNRVTPLLSPHHDVIVPTSMGHRGGAPVTQRPLTIDQVIDEAERLLDELELEKVHIAGNSMGGWMALELARRGRALTACALSPGGAWDRDQPQTIGSAPVFETILKAVKDTRRSRGLLPTMARSKRLRRFGLRNNAVHGDRVSREEFMSMVDDALAVEFVDDLFATTAQLEPMDPAPCPITLAWSGEDRLFPPDRYGARAHLMIPGAEYTVLDDVGHIPMLDNPGLVAQTILATTAKRSLLPTG